MKKNNLCTNIPMKKQFSTNHFLLSDKKDSAESSTSKTSLFPYTESFLEDKHFNESISTDEMEAGGVSKEKGKGKAKEIENISDSPSNKSYIENMPINLDKQNIENKDNFEEKKNLEYNEPYTPDYDVEFKKTSIKNDLRVGTLTRNFEKDRLFTNEKNITKEDKIIKEKVDLIDEIKQLDIDIDNTKGAIRAIESIVKGENPRPKDVKAHEHIKDTYDSFFNQDNDLNFAERKEEFINVKEYITDERNANKARSMQLGNFLKEETSIKKKRKLEDVSDTEMSEKSSKSIKSDTDSELSESSKPTQDKAHSSSPPSVHDFVEQLPSYYNPFDDIGDD